MSVPNYFVLLTVNRQQDSIFVRKADQIGHIFTKSQSKCRFTLIRNYPNLHFQSHQIRPPRRMVLRLYHNTNPQQQQQQPKEPLVYPCTAMSVQQILEHYHLNGGGGGQWSDQVVSVVNRSEIMGRPLAAPLAASGATVYSIDVDSILRFRPDGRSKRCSQDTNLEDCLAESNVVVTGVPHPDFQLPTDYVSDGTTVVNVSDFSNVCEESILARPGIKYIPQVGKVTVAVLEQNLVCLFFQMHPQRHALDSQGQIQGICFNDVFSQKYIAGGFRNVSTMF